MKQATREIPRWRRKHPPAGPVIRMDGRQAKKFAREMGRAQAAALAAAPGTALAGQVVPSRLPGSKLAARTGAYRYRLHLVPFWWLGGVTGAGLALHHALPAAFLTAFLAAACMVLLCRHLTAFARGTAAVLACLTLLLLPLIAALGLHKGPLPPLLLCCWLPVVILWVRQYRWRPVLPEREPEPAPLSDTALWAATLGTKGRLAGSRLSLPLEIRNGTKYTLRLVRGDQDTSDVFGMTKKIASLFGRPVTEVYPERLPDGREHEVTLTLLRTNTLARVRRWDGEGIDPATGLAVLGDFPDGDPAHFRFWSPRNGAEQSVVVGVKGSGKSYLLHLLLSAAVTSEIPVIPIVLDPQQGQSLPDWRGQVTYARGVPECMAYLRAFEAGMMARSEYLADLTWTDEDGYERPGMDFYDPVLSGLPLIFAVFDEAHLVLGDPKHGTEAQRIVGNLVKLNRKAGGHLMIVSHTLLLSQLGDMTLRAMVVGGNAVALRTGEALSGGIIGLEADPKLLPRTFPDGSETHGLGYIVGPDNRPDSPMRVRLVPNPRKVAVDATPREMDAVFGDAFRRCLDQQRIAAPRPAAATLPAPLAAVPDTDGPEGRTSSDAILAVLHEAAGELDRGVICERAGILATGEWGRPKPFGLRVISDSLRALTEAGQIGRPRTGFYVLTRPSLTVLAGSAPSDHTATGG
jgi:hypothetical protein